MKGSELENPQLLIKYKIKQAIILFLHVGVGAFGTCQHEPGAGAGFAQLGKYSFCNSSE